MDQRHSKCAHHFILEAPDGVWSLGRCGKCGKLDAFPNWMAKSAWMPKSEGTTESKREFLRSRGIKYWATYSIEVKQEVVEAASKFGIHEAARSKGDATAEKDRVAETMGLISGSEFATYFADSVLDNNGISPVKQGYAWLKAQTDFMDQNWTTGTTDV